MRLEENWTRCVSMGRPSASVCLLCHGGVEKGIVKVEVFVVPTVLEIMAF